MNFKNQGITLIELMITVAIVAILAAVAYPSYSKYVLTSHRTEAQSTLIRISNLEERYFMDNNAYGNLFNLGMTATSGATTLTTDNGYYTISVVTSSATYTLTATASGSQASDTDCQSLSIDQSGLKSSTASSADTCWR
jgi:type IV pilus assembly protein PilE